MPRRDRLLLAALAVSAAVHALLITGLPEWGFDTPPDAPPPPLQARLLPPAVEPAPPAAAPAPVAKPRRRSAARVPPAPVVAVAPEAVEAQAIVAEPTAEPTPEPAADPAADAVAEVATAPVAEVPHAPAAEAPSDAAQPPAAPAEYPVRNVRLVYELLHSESRTRVATVVHTFRTDGTRYEAEAVAEGVGFVSLFYRGRFVQRSRGAIGPRGLVPEEYTLDRGRGDPTERAVFDWDDGRLDLAWRAERRAVAPLPAGTQDPLSVLHQVYFMQPMALTSRLAVATSRKLGHYVYEVLGDEDLLTPMGLVRALHIGRVEQDGSVLEVWLDRDRDLLPARIYSRDRKGTILDQVVREVALLEERPLARSE
jgi:hypothetical protein